MNKAEYLKRRAELNEEAKANRSKLAKEYVLSNTTVKVGDFVKDHVGTIKVERIAPSIKGFAKDFPELIYFGTAYTKSGKPFKNGEKRNVYESNREDK